MAARAVYENIAGDGDLFDGKVFCILQKVPMRQTWIAHVQNNGGTVVTLEKQANTVIADDARPKFAPEGSYSWRYIEQSVKNGIREDEAKYLIRGASVTTSGAGIPTINPRTVKNSRPLKKTRTPFSTADDSLLRIWVAKAARLGIAVLGNALYQQLAQVDNRHTAQSWQDRYRKNFAHMPHVEIPENDNYPSPPIQVPAPKGSRKLVSAVGKDPGEGEPARPIKETPESPVLPAQAEETHQEDTFDDDVFTKECKDDDAHEAVPSQVSAEHEDYVFTDADNRLMRMLEWFAEEVLYLRKPGPGAAVLSRWVPLPKLRLAVHALGGFDKVEERDQWGDVARALGFMPLEQYPGVADKLAGYYEDLLADYDNFSAQDKKKYEARGDEYIDVQGSTLFATKQPSVPEKRKHAESPAPTATPVTQIPRKRHRLDERKDKGKERLSEVPGTPEYIYNSSFAQSASVVKDSQDRDAGLDSDDEAPEPISRELFPQGSASGTKSKAVAEPETQEFSFESSSGSPSRQLHTAAGATNHEAYSSNLASGDEDAEEVDEREGNAALGVLKAFFDKVASEGFSNEVAEEALRITTMDAPLSMKLLNTIANVRPIPKNIPGVWTKKEDDVLLSEVRQTAKFQQIKDKHGASRLKERLQFLESLENTPRYEE